MERPIDDSGPILVTDFDGTMTRHDFYKLAIEKLLPSETPDYWSEYRSGSMTHFEALRRYFAAIRGNPDEVLAVIRQMELDPDVRTAVETLRHAGWRIIVTSAGCEWYIHQLLSAAEVDIQVYANSGRYEVGKGLVMERPIDSPYLSENLGIDKAAVVQQYVAAGGKVAFAGDGFPDADAARLVPGNLRFARGDLAELLQRENLEFHSYRTWSDIARILLQPQD